MNSNDFWNRGTLDYSPHPIDQTEEVQVESDEMLTVVPVGEDQIEEDDSFSLDKFQVVRREFFSHISEPSITFNNYKIGLNSACIKRLPQIDYIQFLVNRQTRKLATKPKMSRTPVFPAEWQDQFGVPFEEHRKSLQINIFDNYAVYGIKDKEAEQSAVPGIPAQTEQPRLPAETRSGGTDSWQNR